MCLRILRVSPAWAENCSGHVQGAQYFPKENNTGQIHFSTALQFQTTVIGGRPPGNFEAAIYIDGRSQRERSAQGTPNSLPFHVIKPRTRSLYGPRLLFGTGLKKDVPKASIIDDKAVGGGHTRGLLLYRILTYIIFKPGHSVPSGLAF